MVQLLKIDRLAPRIEGMLYKCVFDETWGLLDEVSGYISVLRFIIKHLYVERAQAVGSWEVVAGSEALQGTAKRGSFTLLPSFNRKLMAGPHS